MVRSEPFKETIKAIALYCLAVLAGGGNDFLTKLYPYFHLNVIDVMFLRFGVLWAALVLLDVFFRKKIRRIAWSVRLVQFFRGGMVVFAVYAFAQGVQTMPFSIAYALLQLVPTLAVLMSVILFKAPWRWPLVVSLFLSVMGAWWMLGVPWSLEIWGGGGGLLLLSVLLYSSYFATQRLISLEMDGWVQIALTAWIGVAVSIAFVDFQAIWAFDVVQWAVVGAQIMNVCVFVLASNAAFRKAHATVLLPFEHLGLPIAFFLSYSVLGEPLSLSVVGGGGLIVLSSLGYMASQALSKKVRSTW